MGLFGPANMPRPLAEKVRTDIGRLLDTPEMQKIFTGQTMERKDMTPEQFVQFIRDDLDNWARQIKAAGMN